MTCLYLNEVPKEYTKLLRDIKKESDLFSTLETIDRNLVDKNEGIPLLFNLGCSIFEVGKRYRHYQELYEISDFLFQNLSTPYIQPRPLVISKNGLRQMIEWMRQDVFEHFENLNDTNEFYEHNSVFVSEEIKRKKELWKDSNFLCLESDVPTLSFTSQWEYTIFDLVRIYKEFNWRDYHLVLVGC